MVVYDILFGRCRKPRKGGRETDTLFILPTQTDSAKLQKALGLAGWDGSHHIILYVHKRLREAFLMLNQSKGLVGWIAQFVLIKAGNAK